jgi:hypothetical protein
MGLLKFSYSYEEIQLQQDYMAVSELYQWSASRPHTVLCSETYAEVAQAAYLVLLEVILGMSLI